MANDNSCKRDVKEISNYEGDKFGVIPFNNIAAWYPNILSSQTTTVRELQGSR